MNKGITVLAESVRLVDKEQKIFEITVDCESGGIVDGADTAKIIEEANDEGTTCLYDYIRRDFRDVHNRCGGSAGKMNIVEQASAKKRVFAFPFGNPLLSPNDYRLTKEATYPIVAAFRNYVKSTHDQNPQSGRGGLKAVLAGWREMADLLVTETISATKNVGRYPDLIWKNRPHSDALHTKVQNGLLRAQIKSAADSN